MFNPYARVLAHVPRYSVVPVIRRQHVAEHSFYVSLYVAELIERYRRHESYGWQLDTIKAALVHDMAEARMSDMPGPVKRMVKDPLKFDQTEHDVLSDMGYLWEFPEGAKELIKVADLIEEYHYLVSEQLMGNRHVSLLVMQVAERLLSAIRNANLPDDLFTEVEDAARGLDGMGTLTNNDDVKPVTHVDDDEEIPF